MADRYFVDTPITGDRAVLTGAEAHHLAHVMRAKVGAEVVLFDGSGAEFAARIERIGRADIELAVLARETVDRELALEITLGVALPKGDRQRWLVEKAVELGVSRLVPLQTEWSVDRESPAALERLKRAVIEASKQCGRNGLMEIAAPRPLAEFLAALPAERLGLIAHPGLRECREVLGECATRSHRPGGVFLAIGPEGGFSPAEVALAATHGWQGVGFGPRTLRVETAALALVTAVVLQFG